MATKARQRIGNAVHGDHQALWIDPLNPKRILSGSDGGWQVSYDGRNKEPVLLPSKLPLTLMLGAEGIAVGLSCRILPHNFPELLLTRSGEWEMSEHANLYLRKLAGGPAAPGDAGGAGCGLVGRALERALRLGG